MTAGLFSDFAEERQRIRTTAMAAWYNGVEEAEVEKVGPEGFIHGWIKVGPGSSAGIRDTAAHLPAGSNTAKAQKRLHAIAGRIDEGNGDMVTTPLREVASSLDADGSKDASREVMSHYRAIKKHLKSVAEAEPKKAPVTRLLGEAMPHFDTDELPAF